MANKGISKIETGIVYRNPNPHVRSIHAYFPSVVTMGNDEILVSLVTGEAFEAVNLDTHVVRSADGGRTWSEPQPIIPADQKHLASNCGRLLAVSETEVVSMVVKSRRERYPDAGLANSENLGFVPTDLFVVRSLDRGHTWLPPVEVKPPLDGPSFEACSAIVKLRDGRWLWPTSTWRSWDNKEPNGMKMIALVSYDGGASWPAYLNVMDNTDAGVINWEGKIVELNDGRLLAVSWAYDEKNGVDRQNQYAISTDGGHRWTAPASTGLHGQTMAIIQLPDDRIVAVYRRMDEPGLWLNIAELTDEGWINVQEECLWGGAKAELNARTGDMVRDFNDLKFGAPYLTLLPDQAVMVVFWCYERLVSNIRWIRFNI